MMTGIGLTVGELLSMLIALICLYIHLYPDASVLSLQNICPSSAVYRDLLGITISKIPVVSQAATSALHTPTYPKGFAAIRITA